LICRIYDKEIFACVAQANRPINFICIAGNKHKDIIPIFPITFIDICQFNIGIYFIQT